MKKVSVLALFLFVSVTVFAEFHLSRIDMGQFSQGTEKQKQKIAQRLGEALEECGCVAVTGLDINQITIDRAYAGAEAYFSLPKRVKKRNFAAEGLAGFIPMCLEHAKDSGVPDVKEMYQIVRYACSYGLWPAELPRFKLRMDELYEELEHGVKECLVATSMYLGYKGKEAHILSHAIGEGNSLMRLLHYPPIKDDEVKRGMLSAASHEDISILTIVPRITEGLELKGPDGTWHAITLNDGEVLLKVGDTLSRLTQGALPSATHRVLSSHSKHKYSIQLFGQPSPTKKLATLRVKKTTKRETFTFGDMLITRLKEIGIN